MPAAHSPTASQAVHLLTTYLTSTASANPDPADPRTRLDGLVYWRVREMPGPAATYDAFRATPTDPTLRATMTALLTEGIHAEPDFASMASAFVAEASSDLYASTASTGSTASPTSSGAARPNFHPTSWPPPLPLPPTRSPVRFGRLRGVRARPRPRPQARPRPSQRGRRTLAALVIAALAAGSAGLLATLDDPGKHGGPGHYTFADDPTTDPNGLFELLDWNTDPNGVVTGTARIIDPDNASHNDTAAFTGTQHGTDVHFIPVGIGQAPTLVLTGTIKGATLTVKVKDSVQSPGATQIITYQETTQTTFAHDVTQYKAHHTAPTAA